MSFTVAFLCEDQTYDQFIVKPVLISLLASLDKPNARVVPITSPRIQGIAQLKKVLCEVITPFARKADLVVVAFDQDCEDGQDGRSSRLQQVENMLAQCTRSSVLLVCAVQELEVWCLWGQRKYLGSSWDSIRAERDPKERYFDGLLSKSDLLRPDGGRERLMAASLASGFESLARGCPELGELRDRIKALLDS